MRQAEFQIAMRLPQQAIGLAKRFAGNVSGAGLIEYSLIAGLISLATLGAMALVGEEQDDTYDCLSASIEIGQESIHCAKIGQFGAA